MYQHFWVPFIPEADRTCVIWYYPGGEELEILPVACACKSVAVKSIQSHAPLTSGCVSQPVYVPFTRGVPTLVSWLTSRGCCWYQCLNHSHLPCFHLSQIGRGVQSLTFQWNCPQFGCAACQCRCSFGHWGCRLLAPALMWWYLGAS